VAKERNNALRSEHREVKCQWLNEKSELESRNFQTMALNTQIQGTLRKKERDYDKLQVRHLSLLILQKEKERGLATKEFCPHLCNSVYEHSIQGQLSKKVAPKSTTTSRGGKTAPASASATAPITISKPLQRNFSQQGNPGEGTLQMAEVAAAKATIASLEVSGEQRTRLPLL